MEEAGDGSQGAPEGSGEEGGIGRGGGNGEEPAGVGGEGEEGILSGGGAEVGILGGVGGAVSGDDNVLGEPDGETGGDDGAGCVGEVICIYPYVPLVRRTLMGQLFPKSIVNHGVKNNLSLSLNFIPLAKVLMVKPCKDSNLSSNNIIREKIRLKVFSL